MSNKFYIQQSNQSIQCLAHSKQHRQQQQPKASAVALEREINRERKRNSRNGFSGNAFAWIISNKFVKVTSCQNNKIYQLTQPLEERGENDPFFYRRRNCDGEKERYSKHMANHHQMKMFHKHF